MKDMDDSLAKRTEETGVPTTLVRVGTEEIPVSIPGDSKVVFEEFLLLRKEGEEFTVDVTVNFAKIPEALHESVARYFAQNRTVLYFPSEEAERQRQRRQKEYEEMVEAYKTLPWYKRLVTRRPWVYPYEP